MKVACVALAAVLAVATAREHASHDPEGVYPFHEHTLAHPYTRGGAMEIPYWHFQGSTVVSDEHIRLTPDRQSRRGDIWNTVPWNPQGEDKFPPWQAILEFKVHGQGKRLFGDGIAFWYTKDRSVSGPVFGSKDEFTGLGIFFDTYSNVQQSHSQYISVMLGDGKKKYDHDKDGGDGKIAGCPMFFRADKPDDPHVFAKIVYADNLLRLYVDVDDNGWEECLVLRRVYLPRGYFFGVSAATGDLADNHDIYSLKIYDPEPMNAREKQELNERIEEDIKNEVDKEPHVDPQYAGGNGLDAEEMSYMAVMAVLIIFVVVVAVFYVFAEKKSRHTATHFT